MKRTILSGVGGLAAAFGSAVCCSGPLVLASLGLSSAALTAWRPYRPIFVVLSLGLLWLAFQLHAGGEAGSCEASDHAAEDGECAACTDPGRHRRTRGWLITLAVLSILLLISPRWAPLIF